MNLLKYLKKLMPQVRYRLEALQPTPWLAIDCESTGFDTRRDAIVQLALLPFDTHNVYVKDLIYFDIKSVKKKLHCPPFRFMAYWHQRGCGQSLRL